MPCLTGQPGVADAPLSAVQSQPNHQEQAAPLTGGTALTAEDKAQPVEVLSLKERFGNQVWPGLADTDLPIILYNDRYELVIGLEDSPAGWVLMENDDIRGRPYYRRRARKSRAFAVAVGTRWAGSLNTFAHMNEVYQAELETRMNPALAKLLGQSLARFSPEQHAVGL